MLQPMALGTEHVSSAFQLGTSDFVWGFWGGHPSHNAADNSSRAQK